MARAREYFDSAVGILKSLGKSFELAKVYFDYGRHLVEDGRKEAGKALVQEAARIFKRLEVIADTFLSVGTPVQLAATEMLRMRHDVQQQLRERMLANLAELDRRLAAHPSCRPEPGRRRGG